MIASENQVTIIILLFVIFFILIWGAKRANVLQYPFIISVAILGWIVPQSLGLLRDYGADKYIKGYQESNIMITICLLSAFIFYLFSNIKGTTNKYVIRYELDNNTYTKNVIFLYGTVLGLISILSLFGLTTLSGGFSAYFFSAKEGFYNLELTGLFVVFIFFIRLIYPAIFLMLYQFYAFKNKLALLFAFIFLLLPMSNILLLGRRSDVASIVLTILLSRYFAVRKLPSKRKLALLGVGVIIVVASLVQYRYNKFFSKEDKSFTDINLLENVQDMLSGGSPTTQAKTEFDVGRRILYSIDLEKKYGYGRTYYNNIIKDFVPTYLISREVKESFFMENIDVSNITKKHLGWDRGRYQYIAPMGTTELFVEFGYWGAFFLGGIAFLIGLVWQKADKGHFIYQLFYTSMAWMFLLSITNDFKRLFSYIIYYSIFLSPLIILLINSVKKKYYLP